MDAKRDRQRCQMMSGTSRRTVGFSTLAAALLAGCGGSQPPIASTQSSPLAQRGAIVTHAERGGSWVLPEAKSEIVRATYKAAPPLLYATNEINSENQDLVTVYRATAKDPAPLATISNGLFLSFGASIDGSGTLYVTNEPAKCR